MKRDCEGQHRGNKDVLISSKFDIRKPKMCVMCKVRMEINRLLRNSSMCTTLGEDEGNVVAEITTPDVALMKDVL